MGCISVVQGYIQVADVVDRYAADYTFLLRQGEFPVPVF